MTAAHRGQRPRAVVVGAGPVGCLAARFLAGHGFEVEVHEKRTDYRNGMTEEGRTINLSLSPRGFEDCLTLEELLDGDCASVGERFSSARKGNADAAFALSMTNYQKLAHGESSERTTGLERHGAGAGALVVLVNFAGLSYTEVLRRTTSTGDENRPVWAARGASW